MPCTLFQAKLAKENELIKEETNALIKQLESEQGNLSQYTEQQQRAIQQKADFESQLNYAAQKLIKVEKERIQAAADKKCLEGDTIMIKKDIGDIELVIQKLEQEKTNRDHTIRHLNEEISNQDAIVNKLNKEKRHTAEKNSHANENMLAAQERANYLTKIKSKMELTLDELEESLKKEKL